MSAADPAPVIVLSKGSGFFRVATQPPEALPHDWNRPKSYTAHANAADAARLLALATGWPVIDQTVKPRPPMSDEDQSHG